MFPKMKMCRDPGDQEKSEKLEKKSWRPGFFDRNRETKELSEKLGRSATCQRTGEG